MNVVVCVKQIPDPAGPASLDPTTHTLDRSGKLIMDDSDNYGVEMALQLASGDGDEVTLVSMAPGGETSGLRTGLAMGAAKAILVSDDALAGSDALGTARAIAEHRRAVDGLAGRLASLSDTHERRLREGYVVVRRGDLVIADAAKVTPGPLELEFHDGKVDVFAGAVARPRRADPARESGCADDGITVPEYEPRAVCECR